MKAAHDTATSQSEEVAKPLKEDPLQSEEYKTALELEMWKEVQEKQFFEQVGTGVGVI